MEKPTPETRSDPNAGSMKGPAMPGEQHPELPVWQSALLSRGCQVHSEGRLYSLDLQPLGDRIVCTPTVNGWMVPFHVGVTNGQSVTISWDPELSRYIVSTGDDLVAA
jgi:hypothetical protein